MKQRRKILASGQVQGVGFRPWLVKLALADKIFGWVRNVGDSVELEIEGDQLDSWLAEKFLHPSSPIWIREIQQETVSITGEPGFRILPSLEGKKNGDIPRDRVLCRDCRAEILDPRNRRYQYPLTHCAQCGPRYSVLKNLPFDREHTSQREFAICQECRDEVADPKNRRFHAQIVSCWRCGPQYVLRDQQEILARGKEIFAQAKAALDAGKIIAVKGIGGFQLWVDASNASAVARLREKKHRPTKPFALMATEKQAEELAVEITAREWELLRSEAGPIVLVRGGNSRYAGIAPGLRELGILLPSTALHVLLLENFGRPVVATSGNISGNPICRNFAQAELAAVADLFLDHDRQIIRALDDSVQKIVAGKILTLRLGRGLAPLVLAGNSSGIFAAGGDLKSAVALGRGEHLVLSQHLGDLENLSCAENYSQAVQDLKDFGGIETKEVRIDAHPDFHSRSLIAHEERKEIFHHEAHAWSVWAEHQHEAPALAFVWDGSGYGSDRKLQGGEAFTFQDSRSPLRKVHSFSSWPLIGGESALREPRRSLLGICWRLDLPLPQQFFSEQEFSLLKAVLPSGVQCVETNSVGRLFDAVASLIQLKQICSYEGEAAMLLEAVADDSMDHYLPAGLVLRPPGPFPLDLRQKTPLYVQYGERFLARPAKKSTAREKPKLQAGEALGWDLTWFSALVDDWKKSQNPAQVARRFHNTLVEIVGRAVDEFSGPVVTFSGGCFQNRLLLEGLVQRCAGKKIYFPEKVPVNDGGLAMGQLVACV